MKTPLLLLLILAALAGYLLGTEHGREQKDQLVAKLRKDDAPGSDPAGSTGTTI